MTEPRLLPSGTRLVPDPATRSIDGGAVLMGGVPLAVIRLSPAGAKTVRGWFGGRPVGPGPGAQRLARRLLDTGLAHPRRTPASDAPGDNEQHLDEQRLDRHSAVGDLTVVIPVKDDLDGLRDTLASLLPHDGVPPPVVVVDDGSSPAIGLAAMPETGWHGADIEVIRRTQAGGPARARQDGLERVETDLVAFIDAGVTISPESLIGLVQHFQDPDLVGVAPRIESEPREGLVGRYERRRSPLDLGPAESAVGIGRIVPYVPTACLLARTDAVEHIGGFDPDLRYGEDVDLVWRLAPHGTVRYDPSITADHAPRANPMAMVRQRMAYGSAAAPLAERHGAAVAPARTSPWTVAVTGLLVLGHPLLAAATAAWTVVALRRKLSFLPDAGAESTVLVAKGHWYGGWSLFTAAVRTWLPALVAVGLLGPTLRRRAIGVALIGWGRRLLDGGGPPADRAIDVIVGAVDDTAYCAGVWQGALARRSVRALLPDLVNWPPRGDDPTIDPATTGPTVDRPEPVARR